jgi:hypothetical protein
MITKKSTHKVSKKSSLTGKKARSAAKAAKKAYAKRATRSAAWKKGGCEWSRVLGHFGLASGDSTKP